MAVCKHRMHPIPKERSKIIFNSFYGSFRRPCMLSRLAVSILAQSSMYSWISAKAQINLFNAHENNLIQETRIVFIRVEFSLPSFFSFSSDCSLNFHGDGCEKKSEKAEEEGKANFSFLYLRFRFFARNLTALDSHQHEFPSFSEAI